LIYARLIEFRKAYARQITVGIGALVFAGFTVGQFVPDFIDILVRRGVISLVTLILVLDISAHITEILTHRGPHVSRDQEADTPALLELVKTTKIAEADLLEYSGATVDNLIIELRRQDAKIRLLIKHPDGLGPHQRRRILQQLHGLLYTRFRDYQKAEIRCYRAQASLRGRRLAPIAINVGWYTPDISGRFEILGDTNPLITAPLSLSFNLPGRAPGCFTWSCAGVPGVSLCANAASG
jgi:hypothetical protein